MQRNGNRSPGAYLLLTAKGFCMGAADVVPGVSGGTMAFIMGIYEELIDAIRSFDLRSLKLILSAKIKGFLEYTHWRFLLPLGFGILLAVFSLSKVLSWLLQNQPVLIWSFFLGLILASVVMVSRRVESWLPLTWCSLLAGLVGIYLLVGLAPGATPDSYWFLFLSGAVAICAMVLPGISGSFILVLMGKYQYILEAVNDRNLLVLFIVAAGACVGLAAFSRLLGWLLTRYHDYMVAFLTGLMLGSLRKVWPFKETLESITGSGGKMIPLVQNNVFPVQWTGEVVAALCLGMLGFVVVLILDRMARR
ncbi:MAG: DUF368 domain-containing protein [Deltaproteobacteria bacterium]|nr:DUF368 domain-containing protein [Deltaproteobacteria bacterium]